MTRLERSKKELVEKKQKDNQNSLLVFQLLLNHLPTYNEKRALNEFFKKV